MLSVEWGAEVEVELGMVLSAFFRGEGRVVWRVTCQACDERVTSM